MPHIERERTRQLAECEIAAWVARYHGSARHGRLSRIELLTLADEALERERCLEVQALRNTPRGQAEAAQLEREDG